MRLKDFLTKTETKYDWQAVRKQYDKLGIPKDFWSPFDCPLTECSWNVVISLRKSGKTTNLLLLGLILYKMYGTVTQYVRQSDDMIKPMATKKLFETIKDFHYIEKIFGEDVYNDVTYKAGEWKLVYRNPENGEIERTSPEFMHSLAVNLSDDYKSTYNAPKGDLIIYDEFISQNARYRQNEFVMFCDIIDTIARYRKEVWIFMTANTLNPYANYLQELGISRQLRRMKLGEHKIIDSGCVPVFVQLIPPNDYQSIKSRKASFNLFRFGFDNPNLNSITGVDTWNFRQYRHLPKLETQPKILESAYVDIDGDFFKIDLCYHELLGRCIVCKPAGREVKERVTYSLGNPVHKLYKYGMGSTKKDRKVWTMICRNECYFATNETGLAIKEYVENVKRESL